MIRVLQVVTYMGRGGLETMLMNYYRHMNRDKVQFDFLVHRDFEADYDQEILSMGGKLFHVSRLIPWSRGYREKNHTFLLDIFSECVNIVPNARLLLVGDGEGRTQIQEKAKSLGLEEKVIFTGVRNDVADLLQAMDVFVFPSLYEGVPVTMIEAQASGLPCVISDGVPKDCVITSGLVTSMKLSDRPCDWAKHIAAQLNRKRENHLEEIQAAGYDIVTAAKELENFYLKKYGEES